MCQLPQRGGGFGFLIYICCMDSITLTSIAKINLGLHIVGKREDGYHLLESLFVPVPELNDVVRMQKNEENGGTTIVLLNFEEQVPLEKNLAYRAWKVLKDAFPDRVGGLEIEIEKSIPAGAGLGGGSSNAAAVLRGTNELFGLGCSTEELADYGALLGSDVPFFVHGTPLYATGIGTDFEELDLDLSAFKLEVHPLDAHSATPEAYRNLVFEKIEQSEPLKEILLGPVEKWRELVRNDLEPGVCSRIPEIQNKITALYMRGAIYSAMTGSGSAVFGLFAH